MGEARVTVVPRESLAHLVIKVILVALVPRVSSVKRVPLVQLVQRVSLVHLVPLVHPVLPVSQSQLCQMPPSRLAVSDVVPAQVPRIAISATLTTMSNSAPLTWVWIQATWNTPTVLSLARFSLLLSH